MRGKVRQSLNELWRDILLNLLIASPLLPSRLRWRALRAIGMDVSRSHIMARCFFGGKNVRIEPGAFISYDCFFDNSGPVTIGERTSVGMRVTFATSTHEIGDHNKRAGIAVAKPIKVGDGCWIGAGVTILPGVHIGNGTVIAAGAIVTQDCNPNCLYAGVPATRIRTLS